MTVILGKKGLLLTNKSFLYLAREAGGLVAVAADDRIAGMIDILKDNPPAGTKAGGRENQRKLVVPHFPLIVVCGAGHENLITLRI